MEETRKAGGKEFVFTVIWVLIIFVIGQIMSSAMETYKSIGGLITLLMYCIAGFFVLTRYSATFTYSVKNGRIKINRLIGHRNKEVDFAVNNIKKLVTSADKSGVKRVYRMTPKVFSKRGTLCIVYNKTGVDEAVIFEPSREMTKQIKSLMKNLDKEDN